MTQEKHYLMDLSDPITDTKEYPCIYCRDDRGCCNQARPANSAEWMRARRLFRSLSPFENTRNQKGTCWQYCAIPGLCAERVAP